MRQLAQVPTDSRGRSAIDTSLNNIEIRIPTEVREPVLIGAANRPPIGFELPFFESTSRAQVITRGAVAFDNGNGSVTAPLVQVDGSVQVITIIDSARAPSSYTYQIQMPTGARLLEVGESILIAKDGILLAGVAPAWAIDATGRSVPTSYRVAGSKITQVIKHADGQFKYPIVADPWIGIALFNRVSVDTYLNQPRVNLDLSPWGWAVYSGINPGGFLAGQLILNNAGWDEIWGVGGAVRSALDKPSQRQQFSCHALGAIAAGTWNLEKYRPNRINGDWGNGLAVHRCNWETAGRF
jgi:hypothetical protein